MNEIVSIAVRPHALVGKRLDAYHDGKYSPSRLVIGDFALWLLSDNQNVKENTAS